MASWRFYQGLRTEWRWYRLNESGDVVAESDQGFSELQGCMANAETAGFDGHTFQVYTRKLGDQPELKEAAPPIATAALQTDEPREPGAAPGKSSSK
jgi:hypothetical protein